MEIENKEKLKVVDEKKVQELEKKIKAGEYFNAGFDFDYWQKFKKWQPPNQIGKWKIKPEIKLNVILHRNVLLAQHELGNK